MATSCTSASTSRRLALGAALAAVAFAARAEIVPIPDATGSITVADLGSARDRGGWRLGVVKSRFVQVYSFGLHQADAGEDEYAFDCRDGSYTYARRTLTLAGVVVDHRTIPESRWESNRFAPPPGASAIAIARDRFCALKDVSTK